MIKKTLLLTLLMALFMPWVANAQESIPYTEGFENMSSADGLTAAGWISSMSSINSFLAIESNSSNVQTGSNALNIDSWDASSSDHVIVGLPVVDAAINTLQITFSYKVTNTSVAVGYLTDANDASTFVSLQSFSSSSSYTTKTVELNAAPATAARIAIKYTGYYRCYVDDIEVKALPNCLKPTSVTATPDGNITWEGEGSTWNLNYKASSASTWTEVNGLTSMSYTIPNLTGLTTYSVRVQNVCDDNTTTDWTTATFTTPAGIPLVELFNGTSAPTGWTRYIALLSEVMDGTATLGNATTSGWNFGTGNGVFDNHAKVNVYGLSCKYWLVTPALTMENNVQLSFDVAYTAYSGSGAPAQTGTDDKFVVLITTDGGTTWTILRQWDNAGSEYVLNNLNPSPATVTYDLSSYAGQNIAVAFYAESTSSNADNNLHIDNVSIDYIPSCQKPTDLNATNITANSAELSWVANSGETAWTLYWKESGATDYTEVANATNPYTLNGLAAATNYEFYVVANCSADDASEASATFTFATACDVIPALGFSENFDSYTAGNNVLPNCWSYINTTTSSTYAVYPRVYANSTYSTYANTAPNCLFLYSYGSDYPQPQYAILPEMTGLAGLQVTLMAKGYNASSTLKIGTMSDPTDASTFTMIAEQTLTTSYPDDPFEYLIPADCANSYLAIMIDAASGYNTRGVYVDDIVIREAPTCLKPTELAVTGVSTTTVTLGWTNGSDDQTAWQICLNGDETNLIMAESNPFTIEDLTAATSYTAKVRAYCGEDDQSDWSNEVSFTTLCEAISTFPWTENFNSLTAGIPNCWDNSEGTTTALNYMWNYFDSGHEGAGLRFNSYNNSNGLTNFLKTVSLSLPSDQLMQLSFWYKNPTGGDFSVYISTDGGATHETSLATGLTGVTTWTEHPAISLADYAGQEVVIVFKGTSNYGSGDAYIYLDDVTVMEVPSCMKPNGLEVTATTATTATLSWTAGANETAWQICLNGDETNLIMAESNPFIVEDLTASTAYTAKVRAYCNDNDQSDWSNEVSFATECEAIVVDAANPFTEDFEGDWTPLCWESIPHIDGTTTRQWTKTTSSSNIHTGAGAAYSGYYGPIYLVMPDLQLGTDGNAAQLTFWSYNTYVNDYDKNSIVLLDGENEVELWSPESVNNSWEEVTIDLTAYMGQTISLAFKYEGNNAHGWYVDDIRVGAPVSTYTLTIEGYEDDNNADGYYLIASPITVDLTNHEMTTGDFDLYYFDQAKDLEWINYEGEDGNFNLVPGKGYLYAKKATSEGEVFEFTLTGTPYSGEGEIELVYDDNAIDFQGWNLVGNPWGVKAYPNHAFYTMAEGGAGIDVTVNEANTEVAPMTGIFVVAEAANETVTFATENPNSKNANLALNVTNGNKLVDRAIVRFGEGRQLPKFQLNPNHTKLYISQDNKDYAIVNAEEMDEMPVSFKAEKNGTYTLSFSNENVEFGYLHLIDNMTGADVDLLDNPSYSFEAKTTDYASRFKLVFSTENASGDNFVYFSDGTLVINNEGNATMNVYDVTGRLVDTQSVDGSCQVGFNAVPGVYMIQLVNGDNTKTQKIVVK